MANQNLNQGQSVSVNATPNGQTNGSAPSWSQSAGGAGLTIVPAADGLSAVVTASATAVPGVDTITVTGQRQDGFPYHDTFTITVVAPQATGFSFTFGTPTP
jgi:hypothetical protein